MHGSDLLRLFLLWTTFTRKTYIADKVFHKCLVVRDFILFKVGTASWFTDHHDHYHGPLCKSV